MSADLVLTVTLPAVGGASMTVTEDEAWWLAHALKDYLMKPGPEKLRLKNQTGQLIVERCVKACRSAGG